MEMARFFAERPSNYETLLNAYFKKELKMGIVDIGNAQLFGKWWQELFCSYLSNCNQDHENIDEESIEMIYNFNMAAVYFINSVISVGNGICPSPLKEILEHVYTRQRYLSHFLPQITSEEDHLPVDNKNSLTSGKQPALGRPLGCAHTDEGIRRFALSFQTFIEFLVTVFFPGPTCSITHVMVSTTGNGFWFHNHI